MHMSKLFSKARQAGIGFGHLNNLVEGIQRQLQMHGQAFATPEVAKSALSMESLDPSRSAELDGSVEGLKAALESVAHDQKIATGLTGSQIEAGIAAGVIAGNVRAFLTQPKPSGVALEGLNFIATAPAVAGGDTSDRMRAALESYDESENRNAAAYSIAYNMQAARQDEFGEAFFPTIVVTPDQAGFSISIRLVTVYNEVRRQITGDLNDFGRRNIIEAVIDPTILRNDQTNIVPVYRNESKKNFVSDALVTPYTTLLDGEEIVTAPLAMGQTFSLLGISQTEALLETGLLDQSDSIDPAITLKALYLKVKGAKPDGSEDEVVQFNVGRLPQSNFTYAVQGNYRLANLNFPTEALKLDLNTKLVDGSASALLAAIVTGEYTVRLGVAVSGSVNLELATTNLYSSAVRVVSVKNKDGVSIALDDAGVAAFVALLNDASLVGYDLDARRTNLNRRQRGQLLDTTWNVQTYNVPLRSPITVPRPLTSGDQNDSSDLAALITTTRIRASNAAVDELLRVADVLQDFSFNKDPVGDVPAILGTGRYLVKPFYEKAVLNVAAEVDSIKSADRAQDISALIVNKMRDMVYRMYRDSGYKAAADALAGGVAPMPTVIVGTDTVLSRYINVVGDLRTLGGDFIPKIVSTLNQRMAGKIVMTFGVFGEGQDGVPNPLHFGNMAWKPELTLVLPLHRNGQTSKELTVQPSFVHVTHLPVLAVIEVEGIEDVIASKVAIKTA